MLVTIAGFSLGFSLILAIGAQNAFVLRQGLKREHVFAICLTCAVSDAILVAAGIAGFGWIATGAPWIDPVFRYGGVAFLAWYGAVNFRSAWKGGESLEASGNGNKTLMQSMAVCLALTWLNPHVYLDTLVLLGSISTRYENSLAFGSGAVLASFVFFFGLGYGARFLAPFFARERSWQILDLVIGLTMWFIALSLIINR